MHMKGQTNSTPPTVPTTPSSDKRKTEDRGASHSRRLYLMLDDGTFVDRIFYGRLLEHVLERVPSLTPGAPRSLKQICSPSFWTMLGNGERRIAGRCVSDMVAKEVVSLAPVEQRHEYPKKYCRR